MEQLSTNKAQKMCISNSGLSAKTKYKHKTKVGARPKGL